MLDGGPSALQRRIGEGITTGTMADQAVGRRPGSSAGPWPPAAPPSPSSSPAPAGGAWADDDGEIAHAGNDFLMRQVACIGGGTTEMARNVISERVLGMPRERSGDKDVPFRDVPRGPTSG